MNDKERNNLQEIITQSLEVIKEKMGAGYAPEKVNLAEMERLTGLSRSKLRTLKENGFVVKPHGNSGRKREVTVLTGFTGVIDDLLSKSVTNSEVIYERIVENGYKGGLTQVKEYISKHRNLIPAKRQIVSPQGNRGRRYSTGPGEAYQMDWGFVNVDTDIDHSYRVACFAIRESFTLYIYSMDLSKKLAEHNVTWSRKASFCKDQYASEQPEELPSMPVTVSLQERIPPEENEAFSRFSFEREVIWDE